MTTKELVKKYKDRYELNVNVSYSGGYRKTQYTDIALMYIGKPTDAEAEFFWELHDAGIVNLSDIMPSQYTNPLMTDGNIGSERIFLMFLLSTGEITKDQIDDFRNSMFEYHNSRRPGVILGYILGIIILTMTIIGFAMM